MLKFTSRPTRHLDHRGLFPWLSTRLCRVEDRLLHVSNLRIQLRVRRSGRHRFQSGAVEPITADSFNYLVIGYITQAPVTVLEDTNVLRMDSFTKQS